jgi:hypothetical protein
MSKCDPRTRVLRQQDPLVSTCDRVIGRHREHVACLGISTGTKTPVGAVAHRERSHSACPRRGRPGRMLWPQTPHMRLPWPKMTMETLLADLCTALIERRQKTQILTIAAVAISRLFESIMANADIYAFEADAEQSCPTRMGLASHDEQPHRATPFWLPLWLLYTATPTF